MARYKERSECHVLTLAGFAGQPPLPAGTPFLKTVRDEPATYIKAKGLSKPVVVGHSLGGFLALWLASTEPGLTGPIVVVDSLPFLAATMDSKATSESVKPRAAAMLAMMGSMQGHAWVKYQRNNPALKMMMSNEAEKPPAIEWREVRSARRHRQHLSSHAGAGRAQGLSGRHAGPLQVAVWQALDGQVE